MRSKEELESLAKYELTVLIDRHGMPELLRIFSRCCTERTTLETHDNGRLRYWSTAEAALGDLAQDLEVIGL